MFGPLSPEISGKMQQLLLSPTASSTAAAMQQQHQPVAAPAAAAAVFGVGGGYQVQPELHDMLEEELTADIFGFE